MSIGSPPRPTIGTASFSGIPMLSNTGILQSDIQKIVKEIEKGLPSERNPRIDIALKNRNFYNGDMEQYIKYRDAENTWDHDAKSKVTSQLTSQCVNTLCKHLYNPGPSRRLANSEQADLWLQEVYRSNHINGLFLEADHLSTLNDVACFQVAAAGREASDDAEQMESTGVAPLKIHLLGSEEFAVWCSPDEPTKPWAVCTITSFDETTRYQLWTREFYLTCKTRKLAVGQTAGGRIAEYVPEESGDNPYGVLPFAFVHYQMPVRDFWTPSPGTSIAKTNEYINMQMVDVANAVSLYCCPQVYAYNVRGDWQPVIRPGGITHVPGETSKQQQGLEPRIEPLVMAVDIAGQWLHIDNTRNVVYEDNGIPLSEVRMNSSSPVSGVAILGEQAPLLTRSKSRQPMFRFYENNLARVCLAVAGYYYNEPYLYEASQEVDLQADWPPPEFPVPGPDADQADEWLVANNYMSEIEVIMKRRGINRPEAETAFEQIMKDKAMIAELKVKYNIDQPDPIEDPAAPTE